MRGGSRDAVDPRMPTIPGWSTSGFYQPGRHCWGWGNQVGVEVGGGGDLWQWLVVVVIVLLVSYQVSRRHFQAGRGKGREGVLTSYLPWSFVQ